MKAGVPPLMPLVSPCPLVLEGKSPLGSQSAPGAGPRPAMEGAGKGDPKGVSSLQEEAAGLRLPGPPASPTLGGCVMQLRALPGGDIWTVTESQKMLLTRIVSVFCEVASLSR